MAYFTLLKDIETKPTFINNKFISSIKEYLKSDRGVIATQLNDKQFIELSFDNYELYAYCIVDYSECDVITKNKLKKPYLYN